MSKNTHKKLNPKNSLLPVLFILAIIAGFLTYLQLNKNTIEIISSNPAPSNSNVLLTTNISFQLSQEVPENEKPTIITAPQLSGNLSILEGRKTITFAPDYLLRPNTTYFITIESKSIKKHTFAFTTIPLHNQSILTPSGSAADPKADLIATLPHRDETFILEYNSGADIFIATILKNPSNNSQEKVYEYIQNFGIANPEKDINLIINIPRDLQTEAIPTNKLSS